MFEILERQMASMAEELEEMRRTLYTEEEIRSIMNRRREFEIKVNGFAATIQDFKDYIESEELLLKEIHCRCLQKNNSDIKTAYDYRFQRRIKNLYEIGVHKFPTEYPFFLSYLKFSKEIGHIGPASQLVQTMMKNFASLPEVWQVAADYYAHDRCEISTALEILRKGISHHPKSELLYLEAIKLELQLVSGDEEDAIDDIIEESTPHKNCCAKIKTYLLTIFENIEDINFYIKILELLETPSYTIGVQSFIIEHLITYYSQEDILWHTLAQRELKGLHHSTRGETINYTSATAFVFCIGKYKEGFQRVASSKKQQLWSYYLDFLIKYQQDTRNMSQNKCLKLLRKAFEDADKEECLTEKYYIAWLEFLSEEEVPCVLEKATDAIPSSVELWKLRLKCATLNDDKNQVNRIFKMGVIALRDKALPLWLMILRYSTLAAGPDTVNAIYRDGVKQPEEVSKVLKPKYIEWLALVRGTEVAREVYLNLAQKEPYCKELHSVMFKVELCALTLDPPSWEKVHQLVCEQFGKDDADVWLKYVEFHLRFNKDNNMNDKVQRVYQQAMNTLSPLLTLDFDEKFQHLLSKQ